MTDEPSRNATDPASRYARWMIVGLWLLFLGFGTWYAQRWLEARQAPDEANVVVGENGEASVVLDAGYQGHYRVEGQIDGQPVVFMVDTGASQISIPQALADRLGLQRGAPQRAITAAGTVEVYATRLDSVSIGPLQRTGVRAHINPSMDGEQALLGMSFLRHFELLQRDGRLTIRPPA